MKEAYQSNYWTCWERRKDPEERQKKAQKIRSILEDAVDGIGEWPGWGLDVGCSIGIISEHLAERWRSWRFFGVDIDEQALRLARSRGGRAQFCIGDGLRLPFPDESFDLVICAQVYEHVTDWRALLSEIYRVLRPNGICFFSGPNRLYPIEDHYALPLLSWLPRSWAHRIVRWTGKAPYYHERPVSWWTLRRALHDQGFKIIDYTYRLLEEPNKFYMYDPGIRFASAIVRALPTKLRRWLTLLAPNFNLVLCKGG